MFRKKNILFSQNIEPRCQYCDRSAPLEEGLVLCRRKGVVSGSYFCKGFRYDPTRRTPPKPAVIRGSFSEQDFSLEENP